MTESFEILTISIKDRQGEVFSGSALSISSTNTVGPFDILGSHSNMVTTIHKYISIQIRKDVFKNISINSGLLRVSNNTVQIFLGL